jgi:hypothetical protein
MVEETTESGEKTFTCYKSLTNFNIMLWLSGIRPHNISEMQIGV